MLSSSQESMFSRFMNSVSPNRFVEMGADKDVSPYESANLISRIYFLWATPLINKASREQITSDDLWPLRTVETCESAGAALTERWEEELILASKSGREPELRRAVWRHVRRDISESFVCKMGWLFFSTLSNSFLLQRVLIFMETPSSPMWYGVLLAFSFLAAEALRSVCVNTHWLFAVLAGVRTRSGLRSLVYAKALRVRDASVDAGRTVNLFTNDAQRVNDAINYGEFLLSTPPTLVVTLAIIWAQLGPAALAGFAVLLLGVPLQARIGSWVGSIRRRTVAITDERVKLMAELLAGVRLVKFFGWERAFADRVAAVRAREAAQLAQAMRARVANVACAAAVPTLVTLSAFAAHTLWAGRPLSPAQAFVTVAIFNVARFPLGILPLASKNVSEAFVACARIQAPTPPPPPGAVGQARPRRPSSGTCAQERKGPLPPQRSRGPARAQGRAHGERRAGPDSGRPGRARGGRVARPRLIRPGPGAGLPDAPRDRPGRPPGPAGRLGRGAGGRRGGGRGGRRGAGPGPCRRACRRPAAGG